jgi:hypothetical protein
MSIPSISGVTNLNHIMDTVTKNVLTFEKIKTLIKNNNFIRYYTLISNIPTDIKKCLVDQEINTPLYSILQVALLNTNYKRHLSKMGY